MKAKWGNYIDWIRMTSVTGDVEVTQYFSQTEHFQQLAFEARD